jgi:NADH-quinone oxidoreductase subunit J
MNSLDTVFFYAFSFMTLAGALFTVTQRSAVRSAVSLVMSLFGVAGLYLMQHAEFLFAVQIIIYIGGIMLLFLFVIMLVNLDEASKSRHFREQWWIGAACLVSTASVAAWFALRGTDLPWQQPALASESTGGNTQAISEVLFSEYLLPFEIVSLVLLVAVVGSVFMAQKGDSQQ